MVSEIFDASRWAPVAGFDFTDITYHRAVDQGTVRIAFDRPTAGTRSGRIPSTSSIGRSTTRG